MLIRSIALSVCLGVLPAAAQVSSGVGLVMEQALAAGAQDSWADARVLASRTGEPVALDVIEWSRLRAGDANWPDYVAFTQANADWPGLARLRRAGEPKIPANARPQDVLSFMGDSGPQTGPGFVAHASALAALGRTGEANAAAVAAWQNEALGAEAQAALLARFGGVLAPHHETRLDNMLWAGRAQEAQRMFPLVSSGWRALAEARIALRAERDGVNALIDAIPASLQSNAGLAYDRFYWRRDRGLATALDLILSQSTSAAALGQPERWARARRDMTRQAMRRGDVARAYRLSSNHFIEPGTGYDYADLEWLSGYLQLRKLRNPAAALPHFQRFAAVVDTPISLGRAGYWLGRTYEALGQTGNASAAYADAAEHQSSFYGQLAAARIGAAPDPLLAGIETGNWRGASFANDPRLRAAQLLFAADDWVNAELFMSRIAIDLENRGEQGLLARAALEFGRADTAVRLSKQAAREGLVFADTAYPLLDVSSVNTSLPLELIMSLARQESELNPQAISRVGARGLMQLMPDTAREVSRDLGVPYSFDGLTSNPAYNIRLGTTYLEGLMTQFRGSYVMSAAGYNAGPSRPISWSSRYGDPRPLNVEQAVDWIEGIPFNETRNYVMRVIEGMHVYRQRLNGGGVPLRINQDVTAG
ncbi:lytic transglycosylase domain-containing protein [Pontivivens insulae]|uniref:Soluble lytic murein transglycosylase n=1 Tax=Pontivivens insulae TaxID=1639689 RepID=A0A2R8AEY3_9RHOB|nr:lytic transglycosylase domain-containing protein [Pontivivens insulae]RED12048.1 soluble lytic murein transglycosylase [Pontivivens insulae]SPF30804.1 Soluble lytic murein transglycosylase [Pontivivens insulae]